MVKNILRPFSKVYATDYFACSEYVGKWLFGKKAIVEGKVIIVNNAIDLNRFKFSLEKRKKIRGELGIKEEFVIGNVGRFMPQKNQMFLLDVMKIYGKGKLLLIGDGPLENAIREKADKNGVDLVIVQPTREIQDYYSAMDCFAFPSIYEGLGMALIEAQVNGLKCIASYAVPRCADITNGVIFEDLNVKKWCKRIESGRKKNEVKSFDYDITIQAERLMTIYERLLK